MLHIAAHLSNLVKVSEHVIVRHDAGTALLRIIGLLTPDQRNEIVVELMKGCLLYTSGRRQYHYFRGGAAGAAA